MHSSTPKPDSRPGTRTITAIVVAGMVGIAGCVSVTSSGGTGNVPVVRAGYKNGRDQIVRIALETAAREGPDLGPGRQPLVVRPEPNSPFVLWNGKRYRGELVISATDS